MIIIMKKKILLQAYFHCNLGDDLLIKILCERYPEAEFILIPPDNAPDSVEGISNLTVVKRNFIFKIKNKLLGMLFGKTVEMQFASKCDASVLLGGSMFIELQGRWKKILKRYSEICRVSKKYFVIGVNFGPYSSTEFYDSYVDFFSKTDSVVFRDNWSYELFKGLPNVSVSSDVVMNLNIPKAEKKHQIVISPIYLDDRVDLCGQCENYYRAVKNFCIKAAENGYIINIVSFCQEQNDYIAAQKIIDLTDADTRKCISHTIYNGNISQILQIFAESEVVVATRFHAMILGFLSDSMVYPVIYSNKTRNVLSDIKFKGYSTDIRSIENIEFDDVVNESNFCDISEIRKLAESQFVAFDDFMTES